MKLLTAVNLFQYFKNISHEKMKRLIEAVKDNTELKILTMSNIDMPDSIARNLIDMLEENKTLLTLNIESNLLSAQMIAEIIKATLNNQTLIDLRLSNQVSLHFILKVVTIVLKNLKFLEISNSWH